MMIKNHKKLDNTPIRGIPVVISYCYLGVDIDHSGSMTQHLQKIKKRSNYLRAKMRYYVNTLSFENQFLIWAVYIRPYYVYVASVVQTQTQTFQNQFHSSWRSSFKQFLGLPINLPSPILNQIFDNTVEFCDQARRRVENKVIWRFTPQRSIDYI